MYLLPLTPEKSGGREPSGSKKDGRFFILHISRVALEAFSLGFMGGEVSLFLQIWGAVTFLGQDSPVSHIFSFSLKLRPSATLMGITLPIPSDSFFDRFCLCTDFQKRGLAPHVHMPQRRIFSVLNFDDDLFFWIFAVTKTGKPSQIWYSFPWRYAQ